MYTFCSESPVILPQISSVCEVTTYSVLHTNTANTWRIKGKIWLLQDHSFPFWGILPHTSVWFSLWTCENLAPGSSPLIPWKEHYGRWQSTCIFHISYWLYVLSNQSVRMCTEHETLCPLEVHVICYLNKQVKKSETTLVVSGEAVFLSSS